jgi:hypothetical protein
MYFKCKLKQIIMEFLSIEREIQEAEHLLGYSDGWDGKGSLAPHADSLKRACRFLKIMGQRNQTDFEKLDINPCINGSIQVTFIAEKKDVSLDVNFEEKNGTSFYGKDHSSDHELISGEEYCPGDIFKVSKFIQMYFTAQP